MIFCIEDDDNIRELLLYTLKTIGVEATGFADYQPFYKALEITTPQLVILDVMLPEKDGLTILKELKASAKTKDIPVIMLTAKGSEIDKVTGLDLGADDYITKPFGMMELLSRVKAVLRRSKTQEETIYQQGSVRLDVQRHQVSVEGKEVALAFKEYELLKLLFINRGHVLTRDQMLNQIWGYDYDGESRTVDVHIRTLRAKLGEGGQIIHTVRNVGYTLGEKG